MTESVRPYRESTRVPGTPGRAVIGPSDATAPWPQGTGTAHRPLFASLTDSERRELANRLRRAGERLGDEANTLSLAAPSVLAAYRLPREGYHDFYSAAIEASMLSVEVWKRYPVCRTCGFEHPPEPECPRWAPGPARLVPTGTGWPL